MDRLTQWRIEAAEAGDTEAARELLISAWYAYENGALEYPVLDYLFRCIGRHVLDGMPLAKAFGIKGGRGRPTSDNLQRDIDVAVWVWCLIRDGVTRDEAIQRAANKFPMSESSVRDAYDAHRDIAERVHLIRETSRTKK